MISTSFSLLKEDNFSEMKSIRVSFSLIRCRVELLPAFKFTGKMVKIKDFTGKWYMVKIDYENLFTLSLN
jgi:hypothetical protein